SKPYLVNAATPIRLQDVAAFPTQDDEKAQKTKRAQKRKAQSADLAISGRLAKRPRSQKGGKHATRASAAPIEQGLRESMRAVIRLPLTEENLVAQHAGHAATLRQLAELRNTSMAVHRAAVAEITINALGALSNLRKEEPALWTSGPATNLLQQLFGHGRDAFDSGLMALYIAVQHRVPTFKYTTLLGVEPTAQQLATLCASNVVRCAFPSMPVMTVAGSVQRTTRSRAGRQVDAGPSSAADLAPRMKVDGADWTLTIDTVKVLAALPIEQVTGVLSGGSQRTPWDSSPAHLIAALLLSAMVDGAPGAPLTLAGA
ncbi:hypothetical protein OC835_007687, partial [Tilletia horrida]